MPLCGWRKGNRKNVTKNTNYCNNNPRQDLSSIDKSFDGCLRVVNMDGTQIDDTDSNPRNKCALKPGHSLMDWIRLGSSGCDLAGTGGVVSAVSHKELAKNCKCDDAWLAIRGKVYNVTRYMDFHPGGTDELMKGVGKDATKIFDEVHAWVNYEQLLGKCYVGPLRNIATISIGDDNASSTNTDSFKAPPDSFKAPHTVATNQLTLKPPTNAMSEPIEVIPRFDWIQKTTDLTVIFYTKSMCNPGFSVECMGECEVVVRIFIDRVMHFCSFQFTHPVVWPCSIKMSSETGKIELCFTKAAPALWTSFGLLDRRKTTELTNCFVEYDVITRVQISHDSYAIIIKPKQNILQHFPIGYHISVTAKIDGSETSRSYTPVPTSYLTLPCPSSCIPFLIKSYPTGILSKFLTTGDPLANSFFLSYPKGNFVLQHLSNFNRFGILAAGSGITPMLSLLDYLLKRTSNKVEAINFCYFNKVEENIWCRERLDLLAEGNERLKITYYLSEPSPSWTGRTGHITSDVIKTLIDPSTANISTFCCVCGPQPFNELALEFLQGAGFQSSDLHIFHG
ncbi:cytochrome b5 reductase 4 isoform X2 [Bradysia coprophila]|uniref:cytochrome b5 reductase 4 isoform X2 n=1 Tax=Bradysia coprophila TaxID=38358 RepID=UPI00187DA1C5|nr:cytochrome b5 reductase 4 isoform X2 [Bradysia coprophila]